MTCLSDVAPEFGFVVKEGLLPRARDLAPPSPDGNVAVVMVGSPFSLRFERDAGQMFVHAGNNTLGWHRLEHVLAFIGVQLPSAPEGESVSPKVLALHLRTHWGAVLRLFRDRHRVGVLEDFALRHSAALLQEYFYRPA
jgi:hypothetical protein